MTEIAVFIPWRDKKDAHRLKSLRYVKNHLAKISGVNPILIDSNTKNFSLAAARNNAVRTAKDLGASVVVICDADTLINPEALKMSIYTALSCDAIVLPYTLVRYLTKKSSSAVISNKINPDEASDIASFDWSVGGAYVATVSAWSRAGGQDERFTGWGCEDVAFSIATRKLDVAFLRQEGIMNHLWHPSAEKSGDAYEYNAELLQKYIENDNIMELISERTQQSL